MKRLTVLVILITVMLAGCQAGPTSAPAPPYPQPSFEYSYLQSENTTVIVIEVVDPGGFTDQPIRILVEDQIAYDKGKISETYNKSEQYQNEWRNGIEEGNLIRLSNGAMLEPGTEINVQLYSSNRSEYVTVGSDEIPRSS